jgi:hypothetical protein
MSKMESKILSLVDPDTDGKNLEWIIRSFDSGEFSLEDLQSVRSDITRFEGLFGTKRPLPEKGYKEMKKMINKKLSKPEEKTKSASLKSKDCYSHFKNINTFKDKQYLFKFVKLMEEPYNNDNVCIWIVDEIKRGYIIIDDYSVDEVRGYLEKYIKIHGGEYPLPNFYPSFQAYSNYQCVKDSVDRKIDLLSVSDHGILMIPLTIDTSCYYGSQTSWCTSQRNTKNKFDRYSKKGLIFIWFDKNLKQKFQFHFEKIEFADSGNNPISKKMFAYFLRHPIIKELFDWGLEIVKRKKYRDVLYFVSTFYPQWDYLDIDFFKNIDIFQGYKGEELLELVVKILLLYNIDPYQVNDKLRSALGAK